MEYYKLLQLDREPFSNSPDPAFFFQSRQHVACLQKLELALRLKRGLNVVIGEVGTGKTTLCRELIRRFSKESDLETHLILDPSFPTSGEFLGVLCEMMTGKRPEPAQSETTMKERIKHYLFDKGVHKEHTVVLIIDEGQKISPACTEILRELLNYETNTFKLLQIVLFAQKEFETILTQQANFADRINLLHYLEPMSFADTRRMIQHRLKLAGSTAKPASLFTGPALWAIYKASKGYPRRIIHVCHQSMLAMIIQNKTKAGWAIIQSCKSRIRPSKRSLKKKIAWTAALVLGITFIAMALTPKRLSWPPDVEQPTSYKIDTPPRTAPDSPLAKALPEPSVSSIADTMVTVDRPALPSEPEADNTAVPEPENPVTQPLEAVATGSSVTTQVRLTAQNEPADRIETPPLHFEPPALLGSLRVLPGDTIGRLIATVYGTYRNRYLRLLLDANPHIQNPDSIEPGDEIHFPALGFDTRIPSINGNWIVLETVHSLPESRKRLNGLQERTGIALRLIPEWSAANGLRFQITVKGYFASPQSVDQYLSELPLPLAVTSTVISGWENGTVLYSDPFAGGMRKR